jgi:hypothetical protein
MRGMPWWGAGSIIYGMYDPWDPVDSAWLFLNAREHEWPCSY